MMVGSGQVSLSGSGVAGGGVPPRKGGNFVPVAAGGHRAPAAAVGAGGVVKEKAAAWVGTKAQRRSRAFGDDFGRRTRHGCQQPLKAILAGNERDFPTVVCRS